MENYNYLLISDAAKEVHVESHVLRYWEEELHLPIRRNELGHRYYTKEDVERFKQIKNMKERGLQLKAIKMILKDGKIDVMMPEEEKEAIKKQEDDNRAGDKHNVDSRAVDNRTGDNRGAYHKETDNKADVMSIDIVDSRDTAVVPESKEDKARRLQWLLQQLIRETLQENNRELCSQIKDNVVKELDYQFRAREEREEERDRRQVQRNEEYYQRMDELLRTKSRKRGLFEDRGRRKRGEEDRTVEKPAESEQHSNDGNGEDNAWEDLKDVKVAGQTDGQEKKAATVDEKIARKTAQKAAQKAEKGKRKRHFIF